MEKNKNRQNNIGKLGFIFTLLILLSFVFTYAYYTNAHRFFQESVTSVNSGLALERNTTDFLINGCGTGTVLDTVTGLCWLQNMSVAGQMNWTNAKTYCSNLNYAQHTDWVLPSRDELTTLMSTSTTTPCSILDSSGFTNCVANIYWSGNQIVYSTYQSWVVNFGNDGEYFANQNASLSYHVTCVR